MGAASTQPRGLGPLLSRPLAVRGVGVVGGLTSPTASRGLTGRATRQGTLLRSGRACSFERQVAVGRSIRQSPRGIVPFSREDLRASFERAGESHWRALVTHHEEPYPRPTPTPGDICRAEADRLNRLGLADRRDLTLSSSLVRRIGSEVELTHVFRKTADGSEMLTEPYRNYAPEPEA